jgi:hypothetical protein
MRLAGICAWLGIGLRAGSLWGRLIGLVLRQGLQTGARKARAQIQIRMSFFFISPPRESWLRRKAASERIHFQDRPKRPLNFPPFLQHNGVPDWLVLERLRRILSRQVLNCFSFLDILLFRDWLL